MTRRAQVLVLAVAIGLGVNVAAASLIDAHSGQRRRAAAERDVRDALRRRGVNGAAVSCSSGQSCTVTLPGGRTAPVDPRRP
jgi:hypothetical protein